MNNRLFPNLTKLPSRAVDCWFAPVHPIRLDTFRQFFGLSLLVYMVFRFQYADEWLTSYGLHPSRDAYFPSVTPHAPLLPSSLVPWFALLVFGSIIAVIAGWHHRLMAGVVVATQIYIQLVDQVSAFTLNKMFIIGFAVLCLAPSHIFVPDTQGSKPRRVQSAWPVRVLQAILIIQYFTAGTSKVLHGNWHLHTDVLWTQVQGPYCTEFCAWMLRSLPKWAWAVQMYLALAFELLAIPLFAIRKLRPIAIILGLGFHTIIALTMYNLFYFSFQMVCFYTLFIDQDTLLKYRHSIKNLFLPGVEGISAKQSTMQETDGCR